MVVMNFSNSLSLNNDSKLIQPKVLKCIYNKNQMLTHSKYNIFTKKWYVSQNLLEEEHVPHIGNPYHLLDNKTCGYCGHRFSSRNKLFTHLGYMNVDIRPNLKMIEGPPPLDGYESDFDIKSSFKYRRNVSKYAKSKLINNRLHPFKKKKKEKRNYLQRKLDKYSEDKFSNLLENLKIKS